MKNVCLAIAAACLLATGCAQPAATAAEDERADSGTITGSRIPRKGDENPRGVRSTTREEYETNKPASPMKGGG